MARTRHIQGCQRHSRRPRSDTSGANAKPRKIQHFLERAKKRADAAKTQRRRKMPSPQQRPTWSRKPFCLFEFVWSVHLCFHFCFVFLICFMLPFFKILLVSEGVSHSQRRVRSGLVVGHPQPSWRTRQPCTDVLPGPTCVTSSSVRDEVKAPTLLVFGWVEVFVASRGELVRSGVFLYSSVEPQHPSSSKRVTSVGRLQHHLALEHPHQNSTTAAPLLSYAPGTQFSVFSSVRTNATGTLLCLLVHVLESCDTSLSEPHDHTFVLA